MLAVGDIIWVNYSVSPARKMQCHLWELERLALEMEGKGNRIQVTPRDIHD